MDRRSPPASNPQTRASMRVQGRGRDTAPELALRRELHRRGLRYRVDWPLPIERRRRADVAFTRARVVVMVDGCYWHGCAEHGRRPSGRNEEWWAQKIERNRRRDRDTDRRMREAGWIVLRFWEHENPVDAADEVERTIRDRRSN